jgi:hypothetical protein
MTLTLSGTFAVAGLRVMALASKPWLQASRTTCAPAPQLAICSSPCPPCVTNVTSTSRDPVASSCNPFPRMLCGGPLVSARSGPPLLTPALDGATLTAGLSIAASDSPRFAFFPGGIWCPRRKKRALSVGETWMAGSIRPVPGAFCSWLLPREKST